MKLHVLKLKKMYYRDVMIRNKKAELRKDDRDYEVGDLIHFVDVQGKEFEAYYDNLFRITHILRNVPEYGLQDGYAILSIDQLR